MIPHRGSSLFQNIYYFEGSQILQSHFSSVYFVITFFVFLLFYCLVCVQPLIASCFERFITLFYRIRIPLAPSKYLYYMLGFNYFDSLFVFLRRSFL